MVFRSLPLRTVAATGLAVMWVCGSVPAGAADAPSEPAPRITVTGSGTSEVPPDLARVRLSVRTESQTARGALTENNESVSRVLEALRNAGIAPRDLRTSGFSINPKMSYYPKSSRPDDGPKIIGYTVQNTITAMVRDLASVGGILDRSVTLGVNRGGSLEFLNSEPGKALEVARVKAMQNAIDKATTLAETAGVKLGRVLSISEHSTQPRPVGLMRGMAAESDAAVPVATGENSYQVTVNASWEIIQ